MPIRKKSIAHKSQRKDPSGAAAATTRLQRKRGSSDNRTVTSHSRNLIRRIVKAQPKLKHSVITDPSLQVIRWNYHRCVTGLEHSRHAEIRRLKNNIPELVGYEQVDKCSG